MLCGNNPLFYTIQRPLLLLTLVGFALGGNNGLAATPPMTWRSWNAFGYSISSRQMQVAARGLTDTSRPIRKRPAGTSLAALGFNSVGMDEGWAVCQPKPGFPPWGSMFHRQNADGSASPQVNSSLFPDMKGLVEEVHGLGLKMGWYLNPCFSYCWSLSDSCSAPECFAGDVLAALSYGFDSVKIDGCSSEKNAALFAALFNDSGIPMLIENCHDSDAPEKPISQGGCEAYHTYRSSTDIRNTFGSFLLNAYSVQQYTDGRTGPYCWAYADMLMVGVGPTCAGDTCGEAEPPLPTLSEQRSHFGLWCILSSPLTLSMDFENSTLVDSVWDIVTNVDAIQVNQQWVGLPGGQLAERSTSNVTLQHCTPGWAGDKDCSVPSTQGWWKPLPGNSTAVFLVNNDPLQTLTARAALSGIPGLACATCAVYNIWTQQETGETSGTFSALLAPHDSAFVVLSPPGRPPFKMI
jgi:alpha-galactosidase